MNRNVKNYLADKFKKSVIVHWWETGGVLYCILGRGFDLIFLRLIVAEQIVHSVDKIIADGYNKNAIESGQVESLEWTA